MSAPGSATKTSIKYGKSNPREGDQQGDTAGNRQRGPGGLEQVAYGPVGAVPEAVLAEYRSGKRLSYRNSKKPFPHNAAVCIIAPTEEEEAELAREIASKLNRTKGPTLLAIPMRE